MLDEVLHFDKELFLFINAAGSSTWDGFWLWISYKWTWIPLYALLLYLLYRQWGAKQTIILTLGAVLLIVCTDQLANFFKYGVQRLRPCFDPEMQEGLRLVKDSCGGRFGFFSAHAANSFAIAFFFTHMLRSTFRRIGILLMVWAFLVAYSRIYIGVHFPLDVFAGAAIGLILSWLFAKLSIFALNRFPL